MGNQTQHIDFRYGTFYRAKFILVLLLVPIKYDTFEAKTTTQADFTDMRLSSHMAWHRKNERKKIKGDNLKKKDNLNASENEQTTHCYCTH